jgi:hypothetical protein
VIQVRFDSLPDGGAVLRNHLSSRNAKESHPHAALLQATNLKIYEDSITGELIKEQSATVWIRVPGSRASEPSGNCSFSAERRQRNDTRRIRSISDRAGGEQ